MSGIELLAIASLATAGTQVYQGIQAKKSAESQADDLEAFNRMEVDRIREDGRRLLGRQRAAFGKSGVRVDLGTPLDVLAATSFEIEEEAMRRKFAGDTQVSALQREGDLARLEGFTGAAGTLLGGAVSLERAGAFTASTGQPPKPFSRQPTRGGGRYT